MAFVHAAGSGDNNLDVPADIDRLNVVRSDLIAYRPRRRNRIVGGSTRLERDVMKKRHLAAAVFVGAFALGTSLFAHAQNQAPAEAAPPAARPAGGGLTILEFKPAMDDLMTMLIQPRHLKLYYAGEAKNWKLAEFQLRELRQALARIGRTIPTYRRIGVDDAVASIFTEKAVALEAAVKAADPPKFKAAYGEMTAACNACHAGMEHEFLVIKVPEANVYPNQEFRP
jgi:hypothetical protein